MAATIDQQFIEYIAKAIVGNPDKVKVERTIDERGVLLELYVDPEDLGRVIGRNGTTAKSIRTLLRALGTKNDARYNLKIVDTGDGSGRRERRDDQPDESSQTPSDQPQVASDEPVEEVAATSPDEPAEDVGVSADDDAPTVDDASVDEPAQEEGQSDIDRHREDLKDLTDLDI